MNIRELRYFIEISRLGSFSKAAAALNVAQPALSRQMMKLEDELGVQLFVRNAKGVELTESGAILFAQAEAIVHQCEQVKGLVAGKSEKFHGHIVLGLPPTCGLLIGPEIYQLFRSRWPSATLLLREGINSSLEEWLLDRRLDLAVMHNPLPLEGIDFEPLLHERLVVINAPNKNGEVTDKQTIRLRDLNEIPLILPALPHSNRRLVERAAAQHGAHLNIVSEVDSVRFTKALVKMGLGATIQTYASVANEVAAGELSIIWPDQPPLMSTLCIGMPREAKTVWLVAEVARMLRQVIAGLVQKGQWPGARMVVERENLVESAVAETV